MPLARAAQGALHYDIVDQVAPWQMERDPILFHHGIGASAELWTGWRPALADRYRLVAFDMRGYGRSHIPHVDSKWSLDLLVDDLFAVADAAGLIPTDRTHDSSAHRRLVMDAILCGVASRSVQALQQASTMAS